MGKSFYLICAKCGDDNLMFRIQEPDEFEKDSGVSVICTDCGTLTAVEEHNERMREVCVVDTFYSGICRLGTKGCNESH